LRIEVLREIPEDDRLRSGWNRLVHEVETAEVFYTYEWALSVQRAYGKSLVPLLALGWEDEQLVGVASLATDARHMKAFFLAANTADYCDFLSHPADRPRFVLGALEQIRELGIKHIVFANLPADSATSSILRSASRACGYHRMERHGYWCAQVKLGSVAERMEVRLSSTGRKTLRRCLNSLSKEGEVKLRSLRNWDDVSEVLPKFSRAHVARFLATNRISNLCRPERRAFLQELSWQFSGSNILALSQLMVGDQPVAWNYGFQFEGSWFWYQPTFESRWERDSPGLCLLSKILFEASENSAIQVVDLGLGAEGYKERFATTARQTLHVTLNARKRDHVKDLVRHHAAELLKKSPSVEQFARAIRRQIQLRRKQISQFGFLEHGLTLGRRLWRQCFGQEQVLLYVWSRTTSALAPRGNESLVEIDLDLLADAAIHYFDDQDTLNYLLRSASRLHSEQPRGFALLNEASVPVHFCWASPFRDFNMAELKVSVSVAGDDASVIYDCWTPPALRGQNLYSNAISHTAELLASEGRVPWIFSAAENRASIRGIEKSGFRRQGVLVQNKHFFVRTLRPQPAANTPPSFSLRAS
jgi:CelD/BcsL family acetyltransferase involved in cellulose biosynthesis